MTVCWTVIPQLCHIFLRGIIPGVTYGPLLSPICQPGKNGKISYITCRDHSSPPPPTLQTQAKGENEKKSYLASKGIRSDPVHLLSCRAKNGTIIYLGR
jgi:hypothetical protein